MPPRNPYGNSAGQPMRPRPPQPPRPVSPGGPVRPVGPVASGQQYMQPRPRQLMRPVMPAAANRLRALPGAIKQHRYRRPLIAGVVGLVVVIVALIMVITRASNADELFQLALANMLTTKNYTQQTVSGQDVITIKADVNDIKQPKVAADFDLRSSNVKVSGYADNTQRLIRFGSYSFKQSSVDITSIKDKWVQISKQGQSVNTISDGLGFADLFDPATASLGRFVIGNIASSSRYSLVESIKNTGVYTYDTKKVQDASVNGQSARRYTVTFKNGPLRNFNQKVAALANITQDQADTVLSGKVGDADVVMNVYIGTDSQRVLKIESTTGKSTVTTFTDYDTTQVGQAPTAEAQSPAILRR